MADLMKEEIERREKGVGTVADTDDGSDTPRALLQRQLQLGFNMLDVTKSQNITPAELGKYIQSIGCEALSEEDLVVAVNEMEKTARVPSEQRAGAIDFDTFEKYAPIEALLPPPDPYLFLYLSVRLSACPSLCLSVSRCVPAQSSVPAFQRDRNECIASTDRPCLLSRPM